MKLVEHLKDFQVVSSHWRLSPNARSLYLALLWEFDQAQYTDQMFLLNGYLQDVSGVTSTSSFDSARNKLMAVKLIAYKKNYYSLLSRVALEKVQKSRVRILENLSSSISCENKTPLPPTLNTNSNSACARGGVERVEKAETPLKSSETAQKLPPSNVSEEVARAWQRWENRSMKMGEMMMLMAYEKQYGTAEVVKAIDKAGMNDKYDHLTLNYIEAILKPKKAKAKAESVTDYGGEDIPPESWEV